MQGRSPAFPGVVEVDVAGGVEDFHAQAARINPAAELPEVAKRVVRPVAVPVAVAVFNKEHARGNGAEITGTDFGGDVEVEDDCAVRGVEDGRDEGVEILLREGGADFDAVEFEVANVVFAMERKKCFGVAGKIREVARGVGGVPKTEREFVFAGKRNERREAVWETFGMRRPELRVVRPIIFPDSVVGLGIDGVGGGAFLPAVVELHNVETEVCGGGDFKANKGVANARVAIAVAPCVAEAVGRLVIGGLGAKRALELLE